MALASQAALLDELMGRNRNDTSNSNRMRWDDDDVCKMYLAGFCPNDLFINTKADMGLCELLHDNKLVEEYKRSKSYKKKGYERDLYRLLEKMVIEADRKIASNKRRLKENGSTVIGGIIVERRRKIEELTTQIELLLKQVEDLGNQGKIMESQLKMTECEDLQREKRFFENDIELHTNNAKEMEVCEICGAMQVKNDIELRVKEHEAGRMHVGFSKVRDFLEKAKNEPEKTETSPKIHRTQHRSRSRSRDRHSRDRKREHRYESSRHKRHESPSRHRHHRSRSSDRHSRRRR